MWFKLATRRIGVQVSTAWAVGISDVHRERYGVGLDKALVFFDGKATDYYVDADEWREYEAGLERLLHDDAYVATMPSEARAFLEELLSRVTRELTRVDVAALSNAELVRLYGRVAEWNAQWYSRMWMVFVSSEPIAKTVRNELTALGLSPVDASRWMLELSTPLEPNDVLNERKSALTLALKRPGMTGAAFEDALRKHWEAFRHIPMFDFNHDPYTLEHFRNEIDELTKPQDELDVLTREFTNRREKLATQLAELQLAPSSRASKLINLLKESVFTRDYRDMLRQKFNLALRPFYGEIGKRLGLTVHQTSMLTNDEIQAGLKGRETQSVLGARASAREHTHVFLYHKGDVKVHSGAQALQIMANEVNVDAAGASFVQGISAAPGKASGPARIVRSNLDLTKVQKGDVLVSPMTRQDFVPAMRKAVAIVTDEGGVTCHAAIIARELGVPCIVGAKNATRAFKDGDVVVVDAIEGTVTRAITARTKAGQ